MEGCEAMEQEAIIQTEGLNKHYKNIHALNDLSITINKGDIYGFLGPNGSGKTTTIKLMLGLIRPSSGMVSINGFNVQHEPSFALDRVGSIVETPKFYTYLSAYQNLKLSGKLIPKFDPKEIMPALEMVGLAKARHQKTETFSLGMKQRLGLAMAILHEPQVVILDEPTIALDPQGMKEIRDLIVRLNQDNNITFFISTHLLYEVEQICNRVSILKKGLLIYEGKVNERLQPNDETIEIFPHDMDNTIKFLETLSYVSKITAKETSIQLILTKGTTGELNYELHQEGLRINYLLPKNPSLEDFFLEITKGEQENA